MFKTTVAVLREQLRESQRRERVLLDMVRDLNDRLADAHGRPWTPAPADTKPTATVDGIVSYTFTPEQDALTD